MLQEATVTAARQPLPPMGPSVLAGPPHLARAAGSSASGRLCCPSPGRGHSPDHRHRHRRRRRRHPQASASWRHHSALLTPKQIRAAHGAGQGRTREGRATRLAALRAWLASQRLQGGVGLSLGAGGESLCRSKCLDTRFGAGTVGSKEKVSRFRLGAGRFIMRGWVDFHGDPEVKTPHSQFRGHGFDPWW